MEMEQLMNPSGTSTPPAVAAVGGGAGGAAGDAIHRNLMINFLPQSWKTEDLQSFFSQFGQIEECRVITDRSTAMSKGYGFVKFQSRTDAENALSQAQGMQVEGKQLKIQKAALGKQPTGPVSLYLAGFDPTTFGMNELRGLLAPYGNVVGVKVHPSQPGKKGVAFVSMENWAEASAAAQALNGVAHGGDTLIVRVSEASSKRTGSSGGGGGGGRGGGGGMLGGLNIGGMGRGGGRGRGGGGGGGQQQVMVLPQYGGGPTAVTVGGGQPNMQYLQQYQAGAGGGLSVLPQAGAGGLASGTPESSYCLFVYGVRGMDEAFLWKLFGQFGAITSAQAPPGKNYGFVKMPNFTEAQNAVNTLNGCMLQGATVPLQVSFKDNKTMGGK